LYDKVIFYNHFGNGDIFTSKEFVREYINRIPANEYVYAHQHGQHLLSDLTNLNYTEISEPMSAEKAWVTLNNNLYINTWIGRDGKYVLPGVGCVIENFYKMHNDILFSMGLPCLEKDIYSYIPQMEFGDGTRKFRDNILSLYDYKHVVMICNGNVHSNQAENFSFNLVIDQLSDAFPEILFITTAHSWEKGKKNVLDVSSLDLIELACWSEICTVIVGRNSGPFLFSQHIDNWMDNKKHSICFCYQKQASHFVLSDHLPMKKYWSSATSSDNVFKEIEKVLNSL
jgi:hypothetical protein